MMTLILTGIIGIILMFWWRMYEKLQYWKKKGIPSITAITDFKNSFLILINRLSLNDLILKVYNTASDIPIYGIYVCNMQMLVVKDPELLRKIMIKDFDHFTDHMDLWRDETHPLFSKNLFALKGKRWHAMRTTLSPAFTGSKMHFMFQLMRESGEQLVRHFDNKLVQTENNEKLLEIELRDICTRFTNDLITTITLGIRTNSLEDKDNQFYKIGQFLEDIKFWRIMFVTQFPRIAQFFNVKIIPDWISTFFRNTIRESIAMRQKQNIIRPDMIHILTEAKRLLEQDADIEKNNEFVVNGEDVAKQSLEKLILTEDDLVAQVFVFFTGGFGNVALTMCWASYELACNPDIQDKLYKVIKQTLDKEQLTYAVLTKMKYLDLVVTETLRKHPPLTFTHREVTKPYKIKTEKGDINLETGMTIFIPILGLHRDPKYYSNPDRFDPERFTDQNKIHPFAYLPFGNGPRICIASRLALMEVKVFLVYLLSKFELFVIDKTSVEPKLKNSLFLEPVEGFWLGIKRRNVY